MNSFLLLLQAGGVSMDIDQMKFENLALIVGFGMTAIALCFMHGITLKWGDKEIVIGGLKKLLSKKDEDTRLKESLKRYADDIDHEVQADLFELIEDIDDKIQKMIDGDHCYFTLSRFSGIIKTELHNRVRRNNLKEKLCEESRAQYIERILSNIEKRYDLFQAKAAAAKCNDIYQKFPEIRKQIKTFVSEFFDVANKILIQASRKKIKKYEEEKPNFKTAEARKFCCDDCIAKNMTYISDLQKVKKYDDEAT